MTKVKNTVKMSLISDSPRFRNQWNPIPPGGQVNSAPSMTKPDDTMTVVELLDIFGGSLADNLGRKLYYDGIGDEVDIQDDYLAGQHWDSLDIVEKHEVLKRLNNDFSRLNAGVKKGQQEKAEQLAQQRLAQKQRDDMFDKWLEEQKQAQPK